MRNLGLICDPGRVRTCNQRSRNPPFYPVELRGLFLREEHGEKMKKPRLIFYLQ